MRYFLSTCILVLLFYAAAHAVSIDELSKTVVFLRQQSQELEMKGDKTVELWYRDPATKEFKPKLKSMSGTGLLIRYNNRDYLVTAKHVANALSPTAEIIINLPDGKSQSLMFGWLSQQEIIKRARWFHHPKVDISVHPMAYPGHFDALAIGEELYPKKDTEIPLLTPAYVVGFPTLGHGVRSCFLHF